MAPPPKDQNVAITQSKKSSICPSPLYYLFHGAQWHKHNARHDLRGGEHKAATALSEKRPLRSRLIVPSSACGNFSGIGIEVKSGEMDGKEEERSRKRLGGVSESNLSNLSFGNWFLLGRHSGAAHRQSNAGQEEREWGRTKFLH